MWRHIASNALTLMVFVLLGVGVAFLWAQRQYENPGPLTQAICLQVPPGSNATQVADNLEEQGAVSSGMIFRVGMNYSGKAPALKAGSFRIPEGAAMTEIIEVITGSGVSTCGSELVYRIGVLRTQIQLRELDPATNRFEAKFAFDPVAEPVPEGFAAAREQADLRYRIALAEGATSWQITEALKAADFLDGDVGDVPAEGSLAPDSYEVRAGADRNEILADMAARQTAVLEEAWRNRAPDLPLETIEEALILASIVEKETGLAEERRQVASVFINRLRQGMRLQTDPTVIYGVTRGQGALGRGLRQSELRRETEWNTYVIDGLPITPIANPGKAAIEAALNPDDTPYIFFVADGTGGHAFAVTLAEHNANVAKWRKIEAERANQ